MFCRCCCCCCRPAESRLSTHHSGQRRETRTGDRWHGQIFHLVQIFNLVAPVWIHHCMRESRLNQLLDRDSFCVSVQGLHPLKAFVVSECESFRDVMSPFSLFLSSFLGMQRILGYVRPRRIVGTGRSRSIWRSLQMLLWRMQPLNWDAAKDHVVVVCLDVQLVRSTEPLALCSHRLGGSVWPG